MTKRNPNAAALSLSGIARALGLGLGLALLSSTAARADGAADLYKGKCAACHAADGSGSAVGKTLGTHDLRSADVQKASDGDLADIITKGKNKMPAYASSLKPADIKGLVTYIRSFAGKA